MLFQYYLPQPTVAGVRERTRTSVERPSTSPSLPDAELFEDGQKIFHLWWLRIFAVHSRHLQIDRVEFFRHAVVECGSRCVTTRARPAALRGEHCDDRGGECSPAPRARVISETSASPLQFARIFRSRPETREPGPEAGRSCLQPRAGSSSQSAPATHDRHSIGRDRSITTKIKSATPSAARAKMPRSTTSVVSRTPAVSMSARRPPIRAFRQQIALCRNGCHDCPIRIEQCVEQADLPRRRAHNRHLRALRAPVVRAPPVPAVYRCLITFSAVLLPRPEEVISLLKNPATLRGARSRRRVPLMTIATVSVPSS